MTKEDSTTLLKHFPLGTKKMTTSLFIVIKHQTGHCDHYEKESEGDIIGTCRKYINNNIMENDCGDSVESRKWLPDFMRH